MKLSPKQLLAEFKAFAFKGNMIDLAVAVIIGTAFGKVVNALVTSIIMPLINLIVRIVTGSDKPASYQTEWQWGGVQVGVFIGEIVNFLIIAAAVFILLVKVIGALTKKPDGTPTTKSCPKCISDIPLAATRCKFCTSELAKA